MPTPRRSPTWRGLFLGAPGSRLAAVVLTIGWAAVASGVVGLGARAFAWRAQVLIVAAAFCVYLCIVATVGGVLLLLRRAWAGVAITLALVVTTVVLQAPEYVAAQSPPDGESLTVLQANLRVGRAQPDDLVRLVRVHHVEVLTVEELTPPEVEQLERSGMSRLLPYRYVASGYGASGTGIWSRYRLTDAGRDDHFAFRYLTARIALPGGAMVQLVAAHIPTPWPGPAAVWDRDLCRLRQRLTHQPEPVVVVSGDFNATTDSAQFRRLLSGGYRDAAGQAGAGVLATYPTDRWFPPLLGIDHVVVRGGVARHVTTLPIPGSDHRALLVRLSIGPTA